MTQTLNVVLTYVFVITGGSLIAFAIQGRPTMLLAAAGAGFWSLRAALQPILFEMRSKISKTMTLIFVIGAVLHGVAAWS